MFKKIFYRKDEVTGDIRKRFIWINLEREDWKYMFSPYIGWGLYIFDGIFPIKAKVYIISAIKQKWCEIRRKNHVYVSAIGICKYCGKC